MSKNKSHEPSKKKIAANRRNAQKSTGPRTPRARQTPAEQRQSRYVKSLSYDQAKLGQNPDDFQEFLAELIADWHPVGVMEMTLVEDLATLEMERRLVDRAQRGRLVARLEREEAAVSRTARRLDDDATPTATREEIVAHGLRNAPDSSGKFRQIMELMEGLLTVVKIGDFSCPAEEIFATLYGEHPSWRAAQIISSYKHFVERYAEAPARFPQLIREEQPENAAAVDAVDHLLAVECEMIDPSGPRPWGEPAIAGDGRASATENEYRSLRLLMLEEYDAIVTDYQDFIRERADLSRARRDALLAPNGYRSALMIRQKNSIDRHIERKIKLLLLLQKERRAREDAAPRESWRKSHPNEARANGRGRRRRARPNLDSESPAWQPEAKCNPGRKAARARRNTGRAYALPRAVPSSIALWRAMVLLVQPLAQIMAAGRRPAAACVVFLVLALILLQPGSAVPIQPVPGKQEARASSPTASRRGDPGPTEVRARRPASAENINHVRDVLLHFESHQHYENKEMPSCAKAKCWLSAASFPTTTVRSYSNLKIKELKERST